MKYTFETKKIVEVDIQIPSYYKNSCFAYAILGENDIIQACFSETFPGVSKSSIECAFCTEVTEITEDEFTMLFNKAKQQVSLLNEPPNNIRFEAAYALQAFREIQDQLFDADGKQYTGVGVSTGNTEQMLRLINLLEAEIKSLESEIPAHAH
jgi:hypothetical protein